VPSAIGRGAAVQVLRILKGERAAAIPVSEGDFIKPIFDWRQLKRWGISESTLPLGSEIRFRELTIWQQYFWRMTLIFAALALQSALIIVLIWEDRRRRSSEANSRALTSELARMSRVVIAGQLTASIAHEIRQPLSSISSFGNAGLNWLKREPPNIENARNGLESIVKAARRVDEVIKSVLSLFKNEPTTISVVYVNDLVQQALEFSAETRVANRIALETRFSENPPPRVMANPGQLQQVVVNLVSNAIDAMSETQRGARILRVETWDDHADSIIISVADSGPGIDPKVAEQLFKPFVTTKSSGMGLGLTICQSIIDAHQGKLTLTSCEPHGAVFRIELPRHRGGPESREVLTGRT
jgi:signal transduction histidine kinase